MTITADDLLDRYPELFEGDDIGKSDLMIEEAYFDLPIDIWVDETTRDRAALLLCAHKMRIETADLMRMGTALKTMDENTKLEVDLWDYNSCYYKQTIYGQEFLKLKRRVFGSGLFVV